MFDTIRYNFKNRNSKKNLQKRYKELGERLQDLRNETIGYNRNGWIHFGEKVNDDSLYKQLEDIREYLGIDYNSKSLAPKKKEKKGK